MSAAEELVPDARAGLRPRDLVVERLVLLLGRHWLPRERGRGEPC